jgi:hypothetical protein
MRATVISVSGFSSNVGKTTVLCELLRFFPGWEAIKITRGHLRSCGKSAESCCVSPLLGERPLVLSEPGDTLAPGKDTGRYWGAGASRVHWVIGTDEQIEEGIKSALARVESEGVFIEGGSFLKHISADYSIMVASPGIKDIKSSAVSVLPRMNALVINRSPRRQEIIDELESRVTARGARMGEVVYFFEPEIAELARRIREAHARRQSTGRTG